MQGVCVYRNSRNISSILMYKEINKNNSFVILYSNYNIYYNLINTKQLVLNFPKDNVHILYELPYLENIIEMINKWVYLTKKKLNDINYQDNYDLSKKYINFRDKFKK